MALSHTATWGSLQSPGSLAPEPLCHHCNCLKHWPWLLPSIWKSNPPHSGQARQERLPLPSWPQLYITACSGEHDSRVPQGLPRRLSDEESACRCTRCGSTLGLGRSPGGKNGYPLQYSCLGNPMHGGTWWATVHGIDDLATKQQLCPPRGCC